MCSLDPQGRDLWYLGTFVATILSWKPMMRADLSCRVQPTGLVALALFPIHRVRLRVRLLSAEVVARVAVAGQP